MSELVKVKDCWSDTPPRVKAISQPLPNAPYLPLSGGGTSTGTIDNYIKDLWRDYKNQSGKYFVYVMKSCGGCKDEADTYSLQSWEVYTSHDSCYEALVILYYAPINEYLCLKKHFGDETAQDYLVQVAKRQAAINALAEAVN